MISTAVERRDLIALLRFLVMLGSAVPALTAAPAGTIEGAVRDAQGRPLPGVRLALRAAAGRIAGLATSRADGRYRFAAIAAIAAGNYLISARVRDGHRCGRSQERRARLCRSDSRGRPVACVNPANPATEQLEEVTVVAKRLEAARASIEPQIGASVYTVTRQAIQAQPGGENNTLNQVVLQTPGVSQDAEAAGGIHVRNEMQPEEMTRRELRCVEFWNKSTPVGQPASTRG
jgi:hypothetical protein